MRFDVIALPAEWPNTAELRETARKYRHFRLLALQASPNAYASTYEKEVEFPPDMWLQRLRNQSARHIIATADSQEPTTDASVTGIGNWVGLIVVLEKISSEIPSVTTSPWSSATQERPSSASPRSTDTAVDPVWYHLNGLFVHPRARRHGLGKTLIHAALEHIRASIADRGAKATKVVILVDSWNKSARTLYSSCAFKVESEDDYRVAGEIRRAVTMSLVLHYDEDQLAHKETMS